MATGEHLPHFCFLSENYLFHKFSRIRPGFFCRYSRQHPPTSVTTELTPSPRFQGGLFPERTLQRAKRHRPGSYCSLYCEGLQKTAHSGHGCTFPTEHTPRHPPVKSCLLPRGRRTRLPGSLHQRPGRRQRSSFLEKVEDEVGYVHMLENAATCLNMNYIRYTCVAYSSMSLALALGLYTLHWTLP